MNQVKRWEYMNRSFAVCTLQVETLNRLGRDGWELVSVTQHEPIGNLIYHFKREIPNPVIEGVL